MRELMANVAALAMRVMRIVVHDRGMQAARNGHRREGRIVVTHKKRGMRVYLAEFEQPDIEMSTHSSRINRRNIVQAHLRANAQRDAVGLCLKSAPKSQIRSP